MRRGDILTQMTGKVHWAVAGIGDIARKRVIPAIEAEPRSILYGFVTRDPAKAAAYPGARAWATIEEAVAEPEVDAVYIALPVAMHAKAAIRALRAGKHVLCEKPMAMNFAEAQTHGREAARIAGRMLGVSYYRRLYPKLIRAGQLIAEGAIGRPLLAEANCHSWLEIQGREWLSDPALAGGGPLYDIASHRIDAMNFLFGKAERACGMMSNAVHRMAVEDSATVLMQFAGGVHGVVDVRWNSRVARDQFRIIGEDGRDRTRSAERAGACAWPAGWRCCRRTRISTIPAGGEFRGCRAGQRSGAPGMPRRAGKLDGLGD